MQLNHVGIINRNEGEADRFYGEFLKIEKTREFLLPPELSDQLFSFSGELKVLVFEAQGIKLEVFIAPEFRPASPDFMHAGLFVSNLQELVDAAPAFNVEVIVGRTKDKTVYFLRDYSGNLIEIKQL